MGTATTVEAISATGEYLGGAITPGVAISLEALYQHAAALRRVEMVEPRSVIGRSTVESIESGTLYGFAAQVDGLARRFMEELGPSTVVATGGLSSLIAPYSDTIEHVEPWLTLHGLRIVYERNVSSERDERRTTGRRPGTSPTASTGPTRPRRWSRPGRRWPPARSPASTSGWPAGSCCCGPRASWPSRELRDASGAVQLFALASLTERFDEFTRLNLGDWIGARGEVVRTKRGELSVRWPSGNCWPRPGATSATSGTG